MYCITNILKCVVVLVVFPICVTVAMYLVASIDAPSIPQVSNVDVKLQADVARYSLQPKDVA